MKNIEFKAELRDPGLARVILLRMGARPVATLRQVDTYFRVVRGRLKRRETTVLEPDGPTPEPAEVIFYDRSDRIGSRASEFTIYTENQAVQHFGPTFPPVWVVVRKVRQLLMLGPTRIHLDHVEDLGNFVEFESLVSRSNNVAKAAEHVERLRAGIAATLGEPIAGSYSDLLATELESEGVR